MLLTPTDNTAIPALHALIREQQATLVALRDELRIEKIGRERAELKVKDLLRRIFGPKSEKLNALQGLLFGAASAVEQASALAPGDAEALARGLTACMWHSSAAAAESRESTGPGLRPTGSSRRTESGLGVDP